VKGIDVAAVDCDYEDGCDAQPVDEVSDNSAENEVANPLFPWDSTAL
jgi:hypothetical protein